MAVRLQASQSLPEPLSLPPSATGRRQQRVHAFALASAALHHCHQLPGLNSQPEQLRGLLHLLARAPPGAQAAALGVVDALTSQRLLGPLLEVRGLAVCPRPLMGRLLMSAGREVPRVAQDAVRQLRTFSEKGSVWAQAAAHAEPFAALPNAGCSAALQRQLSALADDGTAAADPVLARLLQQSPAACSRAAGAGAASSLAADPWAGCERAYQLPQQLDTRAAAAALAASYARTWLGLGLAPGTSCRDAAAQLRGTEGGCAAVTSSRLPLQGAGLLLQLPGPEPRPGAAAHAAGLPSICEEAAKNGQPAAPCLAAGAAMLLWAAAADASPGEASGCPACTATWWLPTHALPSAGHTVAALLDFLLLSPAGAAGLPLVRAAAAQLLQQQLAARGLGVGPRWELSAAQAGRWAAAFVEASFGDPLQAMAVGLLLSAAAAEDVRVGPPPSRLRRRPCQPSGVVLHRPRCWVRWRRARRCTCSPLWQPTARGSSYPPAPAHAAAGSGRPARGWSWTARWRAACRRAPWRPSWWWPAWPAELGTAEPGAEPADHEGIKLLRAQPHSLRCKSGKGQTWPGTGW